MEVSKTEAPKKNRLQTLDHLRGFFIIVIIIDHMSRWPSLLAYFTGEALLWITAAEGFVIISGLLVGYVRGFKNRMLSMKEVTMKVWHRAFLLYISSVVATIIYVAAIWYLPLKGGVPGMLIDKGDWFDLVIKTITLQHTFVWIHFLTLYTVFLAVSPLAIWAMRRGYSAFIIAASLILLMIGHIMDAEWLQWQALFFIPSVAGFHLESIQRFWKRLASRRRAIITIVIVGLTAITVALSAYFTFYANLDSSLTYTLNEVVFDKETVSIWRILLAFVWFGGFLLVFHAGERFISRYLGWLLLPFGTRSLSAYILHGVAIILISYTTIATTHFWENTLIDIVCFMIVWVLLKIPFVQRYVPS